MEKPKIYLDTSVISYLTALPSKDVVVLARQQISAEWWRNYSEKIDPYISVYVIEELERGDKAAAQKRIEFVSRFQILNTSPQTQRLARIILSELNIPDSAVLDAYHLAIAALNSQDYIISWNFKHMVNANVRRIYKGVCIGEGLIAPDISTPEEMIGE